MHRLLLSLILFAVGNSPFLPESACSTATFPYPASVHDHVPDNQQIVTEIINAYVQSTGGHTAWSEVNTYSSKTKSINYTLANDLDHRLHVPEISNADCFTKEPAQMLVRTRKAGKSETVIGWSQQSNWSVASGELEWEIAIIDPQVIDVINESHSQPYSLKKILINAPETLTYGGLSELNGVQVHIINKASPYGNGHFSFFFDAETYLLKASSGLNGSVMHHQKDYQWFEDQDGLKRFIPTRIENYKGDRLVSIRITSEVQYNLPVSDDTFLADTYINNSLEELPLSIRSFKDSGDGQQ